MSRATAGLYSYLPQERVVFGRPAAEAVVEEVARLGAERVLIVASRSLAAAGGTVGAVREALGPRCVGLFDGCVQHTPRESVLAAAQAVRDSGADLVVTLGGGTPIDTVKILQICLAHDLRTVESMDDWHLRVADDGSRVVPQVAASPVRQVIVPTTLSGAEFSSLGAATDRRRGVKDAYVGPDICGRAVILDPAVTVHTPDWLWLSTGIRAVDHAVEGLCSIDGNPFVDGLALHALRLFAGSLRRNRAAPDDLEARLTSQQAVWLASSSINRVNYGASHGIGHALGGLCDVPHGYTSCVMLPAVLRYNAAETAVQQALIAEALGRPGVAADAAVAELIGDLGLPTSLRDVGVGRDRLPEVAALAIGNIWVRTNPRPIETPAQVQEILESAW